LAEIQTSHKLKVSAIKPVPIALTYKQLSCRRETVWRFVSLNILLSH